MRRTNIILLGIAVIVFLAIFVKSVDGFSYAKNPCESFKSCEMCADAAGCGWCPDLKQCQPMAQDGFPIRTKDISTGDMDVSPYAEENLPLSGECPANCETTELGDCNCMMPSVLNSCDPDCYAVFSQGSGSGSGSGGMVCMCPYASTNPKPGPYERRNFLKGLRDSGNAEGSDIIDFAKKNAAMELETRKEMILELQKSTRIHVCSPHTYIIDSRKC